MSLISHRWHWLHLHTSMWWSQKIVIFFKFRNHIRISGIVAVVFSIRLSIYRVVPSVDAYGWVPYPYEMDRFVVNDEEAHSLASERDFVLADPFCLNFIKNKRKNDLKTSISQILTISIINKKVIRFHSLGITNSAFVHICVYTCIALGLAYTYTTVNNIYTSHQ